MNFQRVFLIISLLGFISINFIPSRFNKRIDELDTIATNIQFTCMLFALLLDQNIIYYIILLLGLHINTYNSKIKSLKPILSWTYHCNYLAPTYYFWFRQLWSFFCILLNKTYWYLSRTHNYWTCFLLKPI